MFRFCLRIEQCEKLYCQLAQAIVEEQSSAANGEGIDGAIPRFGTDRQKMQGFFGTVYRGAEFPKATGGLRLPSRAAFLARFLRPQA